MIRYLPFTLFLLLSVSCATSKKSVPDKAVVEDALPDWVKSRPISDMYYVGVGFSIKNRNPEEYIKLSKENALHDLASEITVSINSNSFLFQFDRNDSFKEEFKTNIQSSTEEELEGYELVDTYEKENEYWTYYRLSKAKHKEIKAAKKKEVVAASLDLYTKAKTAEGNQNLSESLNLYVRSLFSLKKYWGEVIQTSYEGKSIYLDNEIFSSLQRLNSNFNITCDKSSAVLSYENGYEDVINVNINYDGKPLDGVPVLFRYKGDRGIGKKNYSNSSGNTSFTVKNRGTSFDSNMEIEISALFNELVTEKDELVKPILESFSNQKIFIPVEKIQPKIFIESQEKNLGVSINFPGVADKIKNELSQNKYRIVNTKENAQYLILVDGDTRKSSGSGRFSITYLDATINVFDIAKEESIYQENLSSVKGVQLDYEKAGIDAYKNAIGLLKRKVMPSLTMSLH